MSSPFEKQLCDHKQVTQDSFGVKDGESKNKQVPKYFADAPSDCNMDEVPVQENSPTVKPLQYQNQLHIYNML
jgi:hypothetical protein